MVLGAEGRGVEDDLAFLLRRVDTFGQAASWPMAALADADETPMLQATCDMSSWRPPVLSVRHSVLIRLLMNFSCTQRNRITSSIIIRPMTLTCSAWPFDHSFSSTTDSTSEPTE